MPTYEYTIRFQAENDAEAEEVIDFARDEFSDIVEEKLVNQTTGETLDV